jgi:AcrR family transcriptional regulator
MARKGEMRMPEVKLVDLSELEPVGMVRADAGLQQRKSADTRVTILEAAIDCLADLGYARTTNRLIAKQAKVSRGAMLHHYATRQDLIESVIDYAFYCHMEEFGRAIRGLSDQERKSDNSGIALDWDLFLSRPHKAYLELTMAARTDEELRAIFVPKAQRHDRIWCDQLLAVFPEWSNDLELLNRSRRVVTAMMSGMILNRDIWNDAGMEQTLLQFLADILIKLREGDLTFAAPPPPAPAPKKRAKAG